MIMTAGNNQSNSLLRKSLRSAAIKARESLTEEERVKKSALICKKISELPEYKNAETVFIYKWIRGEVKLDELEEGGTYFDPEKVLLYPLCIDEGVMLAVKPGKGENAWISGAFNIKEPAKDEGEIISPDKIDLVLCPLTGFDDDLNRLGMGGGYYDRFLPKCMNAVKIGVAFEVQKLGSIPAELHDIKMDKIITES